MENIERHMLRLSAIFYRSDYYTELAALTSPMSAFQINLLAHRSILQVKYLGISLKIVLYLGYGSFRDEEQFMADLSRLCSRHGVHFGQAKRLSQPELPVLRKFLSI